MSNPVPSSSMNSRWRRRWGPTCERKSENAQPKNGHQDSVGQPPVAKCSVADHMGGIRMSFEDMNVGQKIGREERVVTSHLGALEALLAARKAPALQNQTESNASQRKREAATATGRPTEKHKGEGEIVQWVQEWMQCQQQSQQQRKQQRPKRKQHLQPHPKGWWQYLQAALTCEVGWLYRVRDCTLHGDLKNRAYHILTVFQRTHWQPAAP